MEKKDEKSIYETQGIRHVGDSEPKPRGNDFATPEVRFLGWVMGEAIYRNIYPGGTCHRCGYKNIRKRKEDGRWWCPECSCIWD